MASYKFFEEGRREDLWDKHCGYLELSIRDFMKIQERLMLEQLELLSFSKIGQELMGVSPTTIEEFRQRIPFTRYSDYEEFLTDKNEDILPVKPYTWARTSGRTSDKGPKWVPYPKAMYDRLGDAVIGAMIMSSCPRPGVVMLEQNDKLLLATAPRPYVSGYISHSVRDQLKVVFLPSIESGEKMSYGDRVALGFKLAMREGLDYFMGLASVLARMGEQFEQQSNTSKPSKDMLHPVILLRLIRAMIKAKVNNRSLLPKDIWNLKGVMTGGTDTEIYRDKIEYYWGKKPLEGYASTEGGNMAMQAWNAKGMVFFPDAGFLEFIPLDEHKKNLDDPDYQPKTVLYNELELGIYELVFSNFYGGVLVRYRIGDLFEVISIGDQELNSTLPQLQFYSRINDIIDLGNIARITERDVWKSIEATGVAYQDWIIRKEFKNDKSILHVYVELKPNSKVEETEFLDLLDQQLLKLVPDFQDYIEILGRNPLQVTFLKEGAFTAYMQAQVKAGADLAHIKPPHMQPSDAVMKRLISNRTG